MLRLEHRGIADVARARARCHGTSASLRIASARRRPSRSRAAPCSTAGSSAARARGSCAPPSGRFVGSAEKPSATLAGRAGCGIPRSAAGMLPRSSSSAVPRFRVAGLRAARCRGCSGRSASPGALSGMPLEHVGRAGVVAARHQQVAPAAARAPPRGRAAGASRLRRAPPRPRAGSRAGSGSWRGRTRPGRAPTATRRARSAARRSRPPRLVHAVRQQHAAAQDLGLVVVVRRRGRSAATPSAS